MIDTLWLTALALTVVVEVPLVVGLVPRARRRSLMPIATSAQLFTHPLAWQAVSGGWLGWWTVEALVVCVEAVVYGIAAVGWPRAIGISLVANALSAALGLWLLGS